MMNVEERSFYMNTYTTIQDLPLALSAEDVAQVLGISRANAYNLMRSEGFPTLKIGKRMSVPKHKLIEWIDAQMAS
jgi:predicted DNA-binding transcriptional regulator AlpA